MPLRQREEIQALLRIDLKARPKSSQPRLAATEFRTLLDELMARASRPGLEDWICVRGKGLSA
jgi:hypothetical protein